MKSNLQTEAFSNPEMDLNTIHTQHRTTRLCFEAHLALDNAPT